MRLKIKEKSCQLEYYEHVYKYRKLYNFRCLDKASTISEWTLCDDLVSNGL